MTLSFRWYLVLLPGTLVLVPGTNGTRWSTGACHSVPTKPFPVPGTCTYVHVILWKSHFLSAYRILEGTGLILKHSYHHHLDPRNYKTSLMITHQHAAQYNSSHATVIVAYSLHPLLRRCPAPIGIYICVS